MNPSSLPSFPSVQLLWYQSRIFAVSVGLAILIGCGNDKSSVSGMVTFDGQPVGSGTITFVKAEGEFVREGAIIKDGSFQSTVPPGSYKIELNAQKVVGKRKQKGFDGKDEEVEITEELFPERCNTKSELTTKVNQGSNTVRLDIKSAK